MGAQQSKSKHRQRPTKYTQYPSRAASQTVLKIPSTAISPSKSIQTSLLEHPSTSSILPQPSSPVFASSNLDKSAIMKKQRCMSNPHNATHLNENINKNHNSIDGTQQTNNWLNSFVEPESMALHVYLDRRTVTDLLVDGDTDDMPDFYDVDSTISSQHSALFSIQSSISPSSISSISSIHIDKSSSSSSLLLRQPSDSAPLRLSAVFDDSSPLQQYAQHQPKKQQQYSDDQFPQQQYSTIPVTRAQPNLLDSIQLNSIDDLVALAEETNRVELFYCVAVCYYRGWLNNKVEFEKAYHWFERAAVQGSHYQKQVEASGADTTDYKTSILPLVALAQYRTGKILLQQQQQQQQQTTDNTNIIINNNNNAWYYLDLAANNGNNRAEYLVGWKAEKLENNPQKALVWYLSSCRHGLVEAQTALGCLLIHHATSTDSALDLDGLSISGVSSVMSRDQQALCLLEGAADKNNLSALLKLGSLYAEGHQVKKNVAQAIVYYNKAATLLDADNANYHIIHYMLGREYRYMDGYGTFDSSLTTSEDGTTHCHQLALEHFELACTPRYQDDVGYVLALRALAHMYYIDTNKNESVRLQHRRKAHNLFKIAATQGDVTAMGFLGEQYERGIGCAQDLDMALYYYQKSMTAESSVGELALALLLHRMERYKEALTHFRRLSDAPSAAPALNKTSGNGDRSSYQLLLEQDIARTKHRAKFMVARYLQHGWGGCAKDSIKAFNDLLHLADVDGYEHAYYWVALGYKHGVSTDLEGASDGDGKVITKDGDHLDNKMTLTSTTAMVVQPDMMRAFEYFEKAAIHNNDQDAQMEVAKMCANGFKYMTRHGEGPAKTYKDRASALKWYEMAAEQHGNALAYYCAGIYYEKGSAPLDGKNVDKAEAYYKVSAKQGYTLAMVQLAQLIIQDIPSASSSSDLFLGGGENGHASHHVRGDDADIENIYAQERYKLAFDWLTTAAEKQDPAAYRELAHVYENGHYPPGLSEQSRYEKGFTLLGHPLLMNDAHAWCSKSRYYEYGWFVDHDLDKAVYCLEMAVKLNYVKAGLYIAELYERNGKHVLASTKYNDIIKQYPLRSQVGWYARLNISRMVVMSSAGTSFSEQRQVLGWLRDMTDQNAGEASVEPLLLLAMCNELGLGTTQNITEAKGLYEKSVEIKITSSDEAVFWPQQNAYFRLAKFCVDQNLYSASFRYFKQLESNLYRMNHHSPETRRQARQVRYYLGYLQLNGYGTEKNEQEGIAWLTQAADEGEGEACYSLGKLYLGKKQHDDDTYVQQATRRFDQGVSTGHAGCMRELALIVQQEHQADKDWDGIETYDLLERAYRLGDVEALVCLAVAVQYGLGTTIKKGNTTMALGWYRTAAQQGHPKAAVYAALAFHELKQHELAVEWFQMQPESLVSKVWLAFYRLKGVGGLVLDPIKAFNQLEHVVTTFEFNHQHDVGDINALGLAYLLVGRCYEEGEGTAKDEAQAMFYYDLARQRTHDVEATYRLGTLLFQQKSGNSDPDSVVEQQQRAFECFDTAASKGNLEAKYMVGVYHARGLGGMVKDNAAAHIHLQRAIRDGHTRAILELGHVLWSAKNYDEAINQFKKAAELRIPEASYHLGRLYHEGVRDRSRENLLLTATTWWTPW
ncbi:unnamed protein product [Absidia cylindrospora]